MPVEVDTEVAAAGATGVTVTEPADVAGTGAAEVAGTGAAEVGGTGATEVAGTGAAEVAAIGAAEVTVTEAAGSRMTGWDAYVRGHEGASVYHLGAWRELIEDVFGRETHYLTAYRTDHRVDDRVDDRIDHRTDHRVDDRTDHRVDNPVDDRIGNRIDDGIGPRIGNRISNGIDPQIGEPGGRICGVLPLVRLKSRLFGDFLVSLPYVSYGGVLADDAESGAKLIDEASRLAADLGAGHIELRHLADCTSLPKRTDKVSMHLELTGDADALWKRLGSKCRAQIKRPLKEGATCEIGGAALVDAFYAVFSVKYRDLGV
ncbi:MAG TPA: hypothetical protein VE175_15400, partial [Woeseiaceae bacterium]|nr:hypothetical protein [Woeseiaceae bacterium]